MTSRSNSRNSLRLQITSPKSRAVQFRLCGTPWNLPRRPTSWTYSKLTVIAALSDVISRAENITPEQAGRLVMVGDSARFIAEGLHDLIELGNTGNRGDSNRHLVDIGSLVARAVQECSPLFESRDQQLILNHSSTVSVFCEYEAILEAVRNLLTNSSKHTHTGSQTRVSVGLHFGRAFIEVADNGPGISAAEVERVMKPFSRNRMGSGLKGNGVGLPIVKQVVEAHNGTVNVASVPNQGTVFTLLLPVRRPT